MNEKLDKSPSPSNEEVRKARKKFKLTLEQASELVHESLTSWHRYETGDRKMHPALFELFNIKAVTFDKEKWRKEKGKRVYKTKKPTAKKAE